MTSSSILDDFPLDTLGQQPFLNLYTQLSLCYALNSGTADTVVISSLSQGLERLSAAFPWVAGQIAKVGGVFKIKPLEKTVRLTVKDLRGDPSISISALREAEFPARLLDESVIAPRMTLTGVLEPDAKDLPVFAVQANCVVGGLVLTFVAHHQAMDMVGQEQVMLLLAKACLGESFTEDELAVGNASRRNIIPLLGPSYKPGEEVSKQVTKPPSQEGASGEAAPPPTLLWTYFLFSQTSLTSLKSLASSTLPADCPFISTDDALSALIWRHVARSRLPRHPASTISKFTRAVDVRRYIESIPDTYPGLAQNLVLLTQSLETLAGSTLGDLAAQLRAAVDPDTSDLAYKTSAMATVLDRAEDKTAISFTGSINPSSDFMLSSWAKVEAYSMDFGFGLPEAVRRPQFTPIEGLGYLCPKRKDGEIAVILGLREDDLARLKEDEEFVKFGRFVG